MRNIAGKKRARQGDVDFGYLFAREVKRQVTGALTSGPTLSLSDKGYCKNFVSLLPLTLTKNDLFRRENMPKRLPERFILS